MRWQARLRVDQAALWYSDLMHTPVSEGVGIVPVGLIPKCCELFARIRAFVFLIIDPKHTYPIYVDRGPGIGR